MSQFPSFEIKESLLMWQRSFVILAILVIQALVIDGASGVARAADHTKDSVATVQANLAEKKAVLLDVRELKEWEEGRLKDAQLAPLSKLKAGSDVKEFAKDLMKDTIIYCHCRAGGRALVAADLLQKAGYDVRALKQGYEDLLRAGLPKAP